MKSIEIHNMLMCAVGGFMCGTKPIKVAYQSTASFYIK